ncbi:MAG: BREX-1 system adenine-specific DNA-methyltransferase PglX [Alphaproteobacteria bacterium]|nr:BREX-1 system adenine-specific DNA-methyltransferase PglX [Alphaproteobacteria bacterium]
MREAHNSFLGRQFLRSHWALDFEAFKDSDQEHALLARLQRWAGRTDLGESSSEAAFLEEFFRDTWGYVQSGQEGGEGRFTLYPQFPVPGASARGRQGAADAALGQFGAEGGSDVPQVLCEFKDIKSRLDAPQRRKGDNRSPVKQGLDYLSAARRGLFGTEPILPTWAIVTDMNEFRLYWADRGARQFIRLTIRPSDLFQGPSLLDETEDARFDRYLFQRLFHRETLLVEGASGRPLLAQLIARQWVKERALENEFYQEYRAYRQHLYLALLEHNGPGSGRYLGTRGRLVRMAQKILDRCIFIFFCEDMGRAIGFPPQLLRDFLIHESTDAYFDPNATTIWTRLVSLFRAMNDGTAFGGQTLNQFNGGLFAADSELEALHIPNSLFCQQGQGQNEASLYSYKLTLLYLSAAYNYASGWAQGLTRPPVADPTDLAASRKNDPMKSLGLYTLGRIFEQSITELEILEAEADGRPSVNKESKRKRDGVYYTPEWVVERIVAETLGGRLADLKREAGWPEPDSDALPTLEAIATYRERLQAIKVVDPACGSGAFLITALRYLIDEWRALRDLRRQVTGTATIQDGEDDRRIREILRNNLYGVDINPASVEITKLALWLHTARGDQPLSSLDAHIRDGNSLIGPEFFDGLAPYSEEERERINAFDWRSAFPEAFEAGGFDAVIGNPPYVKLQNFQTAHPDMASFLRRDGSGNATYASTQTKNFDLYLPFVEKGLDLLNDRGRLGYIAPSLWTVNEYGEGLRGHIMANRALYGWIDFQSHQIFEEATTYTALQFFSRRPNAAVRVAFAPDGTVPEDPWAAEDCTLPYDRLAFADRWLLVTGADRALIDGVYARSLPLDDPRVSSAIFVGIQTSADAIYHLKKIAPGRYLCTPKGDGAPAPFEAPIEDAIMKPLVSGAEAKRYIEPVTDTYLLFPYEVDADGVHLMSATRLRTRCPLAWSYLTSWEATLRRRESGKMDDDQGWWAYNYPKNLDKQEIEKLIVAQTVPKLRVSLDSRAACYLNNVRVNGIVPSRETPGWTLLGLLNAPVCDFVFRRIAKPKDGNWFEANKQFIAPLPIPECDDADKQAVAELARRLQALHTERRDRMAALARRLSATPQKAKPERWLFPDLAPARSLQADAPARLDAQARRDWAKRKAEEARDARLAALGARLYPGVALDAALEDGELKFLIDGAPAVDRIFLSEEDGRFVLAQWKHVAASFAVTERTDGKKLANALRKVVETDNAALRTQVIELQRRIAEIDAEIDAKEREINQLTYRLYGLSDAEVQRVEAG